MRALKTLAGVVLFWLGAGSAICQQLANQAAMHARVQAIYNFAPSKVTDQVRAEKSKEMDGFWNEVKAHPEAELPLLRAELADASNPAFFFADGTGLLMNLSQSVEDGKIAAHARARRIPPGIRRSPAGE